MAVGDELLLGDVVNRNLSWLGARVRRRGLEVVRGFEVGDDVGAMLDVLRAAAVRGRRRGDRRPRARPPTTAPGRHSRSSPACECDVTRTWWRPAALVRRPRPADARRRSRCRATCRDGGRAIPNTVGTAPGVGDGRRRHGGVRGPGRAGGAAADGARRHRARTAGPRRPAGRGGHRAAPGRGGRRVPRRPAPGPAGGRPARRGPHVLPRLARRGPGTVHRHATRRCWRRPGPRRRPAGCGCQRSRRGDPRRHGAAAADPPAGHPGGGRVADRRAADLHVWSTCPAHQWRYAAGWWLTPPR